MIQFKNIIKPKDLNQCLCMIFHKDLNQILQLLENYVNAAGIDNKDHL